MGEYIAKWHRELGIFCRIKPLIIVEGNVLDVYQYPVEGSAPKGSILRLPEYLHYYFTDLGYKTIVYAHTRKECEEKLKALIVEMKAEIAEAKRLKDLGEGDGRPPERKKGNQAKTPLLIIKKSISFLSSGIF